MIYPQSDGFLTSQKNSVDAQAVKEKSVCREYCCNRCPSCCETAGDMFGCDCCCLPSNMCGGCLPWLRSNAHEDDLEDTEGDHKGGRSASTDSASDDACENLAENIGRAP